ALDSLGHKEMPIVIGGVIPPQDYDELYKDGALAIFGPGTVIPEAALKVLQILEPPGTSARTQGGSDHWVPLNPVGMAALVGSGGHAGDRQRNRSGMLPARRVPTSEGGFNHANLCIAEHAYRRRTEDRQGTARSHQGGQPRTRRDGGASDQSVRGIRGVRFRQHRGRAE